MPINPGRSWCDAQDHHGAETSFAAARPHRPAAHAASARLSFRGDGQYVAIAPDRVHGEWRQDLWGGCQVRPRRDCQIPGDCIHGESPPGVGLTGRGWNIPPCFLHLRLNGVHRPPPPPGAFRASSRPLRGGGQCLAIGPDRVHGEWRQDLWGVSGETAKRLPDPRQCIDGISPRGEGLTGRGTEHPPPLSPVSLKTLSPVSPKNLSRWNTPTSGMFSPGETPADPHAHPERRPAGLDAARTPISAGHTLRAAFGPDYAKKLQPSRRAGLSI